MGHRQYDILWTFHQANWANSQLWLKFLKNCRSVLVCEQAYRTSGFHHNNKVTGRWKEIQDSTDLIISWASVDKENEKAIGVKYMPFGGCYPGIEELVMPWGHKFKKLYAIYQGTLSPHFKNQEALVKDISQILDSQIVDHFVINGYPIDKRSEKIIGELKERYPDRFRHEVLVGRHKVFSWLRGALFGYSPMKPHLMSNFPYEAVGCGVPMWMPYLETPPNYIVKRWRDITRIVSHREAYEQQVQIGRQFYETNLSVEIMGQGYFDILEGLLK
jgi:hypothetical protein